jgi:hypothetical protein
MRGWREDGVAALLREVGNIKVRSGCEEVVVRMPPTEVNLLGKDDWIVSFHLSRIRDVELMTKVIYATYLSSNGYK